MNKRKLRRISRRIRPGCYCEQLAPDQHLLCGNGSARCWQELENICRSKVTAHNQSSKSQTKSSSQDCRKILSVLRGLSRQNVPIGNLASSAGIMQAFAHTATQIIPRLCSATQCLGALSWAEGAHLAHTAARQQAEAPTGSSGSSEPAGPADPQKGLPLWASASHSESGTGDQELSPLKGSSSVGDH